MPTIAFNHLMCESLNRAAPLRTVTVILFTRKGLTATYRFFFILINSTVIYKIVLIIITINPAIKSTYFDNGLAYLTGMVLNNGKKIIKRVENLPNNKQVHG